MLRVTDGAPPRRFFGVTQMGARKQFLASLEADAELESLLKDKTKLLATDEQLQEQRISFAFGNAPASSDLITKDSVRAASRHVRLHTEK